MGSKISSSAALFLSLSLLLFACTIASDDYNTPTTPTPIYTKPPPPPSPIVCTPTKPHPTPSPVHTPANPKPTPSPAKCPKNTLKIGACANLLGGLLGAIVGYTPSHPCCTLINGLVDIQAAACLCTALKVDVVGIKLDINIALSTLINTCGKKIPPGYRCA